MKEKKDWKKEYFSIPNLMGYFRIFLIPVFVIVYVNAQNSTDYIYAAMIILLSGVTDFFDGKIARRFHMITDFGKMLDPIADKLTQGAIALSLLFRYPLMKYLFVLFILKETFMGILGILIMKSGRKVEGARMHGKVCTAMLDLTMIVLLVMPEGYYLVSFIMIVLCILLMLNSVIRYAVYDIRLLKGKEQIHWTLGNKRKKWIAILTPIAVILYLVIGVIAAYRIEPELNQADLDQVQETAGNINLSAEQISSSERACLIEENGDALTKRLQMIHQAQESIILSTFDFRDDESGRDVMAALLDAGERGVNVQILVDGVSATVRMSGNPYFYALSTQENITIKIYNRPNLFLPWKSMGRLHDKYLIADDKAYILGGRNTFDYFLGDQSEYKNYDRDVLVYESETNLDATSMKELLGYFDSIWNCHDSKAFHDGSWEAADFSVSRAKEALLDRYEEMTEKNPDILEPIDYLQETYETQGITLLTGPIHTGAKKPYLFQTLVCLMQNAKENVRIHTPYIICNEYMYDSLESVAFSGAEVSLMTNSVANNGNPFGASDYALHKQRLFDTGMQLYEYDGGVSYHGKSITIDHDIAIVGSFNMDMRSVYIDTEMMLVINCEKVNEQLNDAMNHYEEEALKVMTPDQYDTQREPQQLSSKKQRRLNLVELFNWFRFLM